MSLKMIWQKMMMNTSHQRKSDMKRTSIIDNTNNIYMHIDNLKEHHSSNAETDHAQCSNQTSVNVNAPYNWMERTV